MYYNIVEQKFTEENGINCLPAYESNPDTNLLKYYTIGYAPNVTVLEDNVLYTFYVAKHLDTIKSELINKINEDYEANIKGGFWSNGYLFDGRPEDLININGAFSLANFNPNFSTYWVTKNNQTIFLTNDALRQLGNDAAAFKANNIISCRMKKDEVLNCTTLEELINLTV